MRLIPPLSTLALVSGLGLAVLAFTQQLEHKNDLSPLTTTAKAGPATASQNRSLPAWQAPDPQSFTAIVTAPLFAEDRRMPGDIVVEAAPEPVVEESEPVEIAVAPPPPPPPLNYGLVGVMIASDEKKALLAHATTGEQIWVALADEVASWSVREIASDRVVLTNQDTVKRLVLYSQ